MTIGAPGHPRAAGPTTTAAQHGNNMDQQHGGQVVVGQQPPPAAGGRHGGQLGNTGNGAAGKDMNHPPAKSRDAKTY